MEGIDFKKAFDIYCYVKDEQKFYNKFTKKPIQERSLRKKLSDMYPQLAVNGTLQDEVVKEIRNFSYSPEQLGMERQKKPNKKLARRQLYEEVSNFIPMRWMASVAGEDRMYYVNATNEVTFAGQTKKDVFTKVVRAAEGHYLEKLEAIFEDSELCKNMEFDDYLGILFDRFIYDSRHRLDGEPPIITHHPTELAYTRFDPSKLQEGPTPHWNEFLARVNFPEIFMAWCWSVFEPLNEGRQILWMQGKGNDGKSTAIDVLTEYLGDKHVMPIEENVSSQFFYSNIYGKRMATFGDCKSPRYISNSKIHSLVGGDYVSIERKGEQPFSAYVRLKLIIASNYFPQIDFSMPNETTRLILLKVKQPEDLSGDRDFKANLLSEKWQFLYRCKQMYEKHCPKHTQIELPPELFEEMKLDAESEESSAVIEFIEKFIEFVPDSNEQVREVNSFFDEIIRSKGFGQNKLGRMKRDLEARLNLHGIEKAKAYFAGKQARAYRGVKLKRELMP